MNIKLGECQYIEKKIWERTERLSIVRDISIRIRVLMREINRLRVKKEKNA